jgi:hypothetical protein
VPRLFQQWHEAEEKVSPMDSARLCRGRAATILLAGNVAALLLLAVWFRCRSLDHIPGLNGDEAWYGVEAWKLLHGGQFSSHTPTGNLSNPFFFGPLVLLQACCRPSIAVLRSVSVASGLLALAVNWLLSRWVFDRRTARISTLALAVLPINIAYSRIAWDASQSLLATLPVLYLSLAAVRFPARQDRLTAAAIVSLLAAVLVHPTNIFAGAAIVAALAARWRRRGLSQFGHHALHGRDENGTVPLGRAKKLAVWSILRQERASGGPAVGRKHEPPMRRQTVWLICRLSAVLLLAVLTLAIWATCLIKMPGVASAGERLENLRKLSHPQQWLDFTTLYAGLFSGQSAYQYVSGADSWLQWPALGGRGLGSVGVLLPWGVLLAAAWTLWRRTAARARTQAAANAGGTPALPESGPDRVLAAAWALGLAGFLVLAGPCGMIPDQARYAICLIGPAVVLAVRGAMVWSERSAAARILILVAGLTLGWFTLADCRQHYFRFIEQTGGQAHRTFRTAAIEPKRAALDYILQHRTAGTTWIVTDEYWSFWPLRYLAMAESEVGVTESGQPTGLPSPIGRGTASGARGEGMSRS